MTNPEIAKPIPASSRPLFPFLILALGLISATFSVIFMRMALDTGIASPVIVAVRMLLAVVIFTPFVLRNHPQTIRGLRKRDWLLLPIAGLMFAADLVLFSEAVKHTSILIVTVIGGLAPLWTALLERFVLRTPLHRLVYIGLLLAIVGGGVIALAGSGNSSGMGPNPLLGITLALGSGASSACYLTVARSLRPRIPLLPYIWLIFGIALVVVLLVASGTGAVFTGHAAEGYLWVLMTTIAGQMIAHPAINFAVGFISPTFISISGQSITVMGTILAFFIFQEVPGIGEVLGSIIILLGVIFAITGQNEFRKS